MIGSAQTMPPPQVLGKEVEQFIKGFLEGAGLPQLLLSNMKECVLLGTDPKSGEWEWRKSTVMKDISHLITDIDRAIAECPIITQEMQKLKKMLEKLKMTIPFLMQVLKDMWDPKPILEKLKQMIIMLIEGKIKMAGVMLGEAVAMASGMM